MGKLGSAYHFVGIGGTGMSAIAHILLSHGVKVSGSDLIRSPTIERLEQMGGRISIGHSSDNVGMVDAVVVSAAVPEDNVEVMQAERMGIDVIERIDMLAVVMGLGRSIGIAGTHGKTTTTSMVAHVLKRCGLEPTALVGGELFDYGANAVAGDTSYVVAEVDESDGAFVRLRPYAAVVTNVEDDHLDTYTDLSGVKDAFERFLNNTDGFVCVCNDDPFLAGWQPSTGVKVIRYSTRGRGDVCASNIGVRDSRTEFMVQAARREYLGELLIPGEHNVANALAAVCVGKELGLDIEQCLAALASFRGVGRRFETIDRGDVWIVDDYAHHPTEIKATLKAARSVWPDRIVVVFQPHRYSRTIALKNRWQGSFVDADRVIITDIYPAGEQNVNGVDGTLVAREAGLGNGVCDYVSDVCDVASVLSSMVKPGDMVLTLGAGNVRSVGCELARLIAAKGGV